MEICVRCANCGEDIGVFNFGIVGGKGEIRISVVMCACCLEEDIDKAREEGYEEGLNEC